MPATTFGGEVIPQQQQQLKLLGATLDSKLTFDAHLRTAAARANSHIIGLLRKVALVLDGPGKLVLYRGFVGPLLEYAPHVWMEASPTNLGHLSRVQWRALHIPGPNVLLQSLEVRRTVAALSFLHKLLCLPDSLYSHRLFHLASVPLLSPCHIGNVGKPLASYIKLLTPPPPPNCSQFPSCSFPFDVIDNGNTLPASLFTKPPFLAQEPPSFRGKRPPSPSL